MSETIKRSRIAGCRDVYTARVTQNDEDGYVAGTPMKLARTIRMKITENWEEQKIYSDDGTEEVISSYSGTDVELEVNALAPQDRKQIFDQLYKNGYLVRSADDIQPELALGWRERRLNGLYEFHWMYCGKFGKGIEDGIKQLLGKKKPEYRFLRTHCALYRTDLLKRHTRGFGDGECAGSSIHRCLTAAGYDMEFIPPEILIKYMDHLNHATMILNPAIGGKKTAAPKARQSLESRLARFRAILADDSLDK